MKRITILLIVLGLVATTAVANPDIRLSTSSTDPQPLTPGDTATLYVSIQNEADDRAEDLRVSYDGHRLFELLKESDRVTTRSFLGGREDLTIAYDVTIPENAPTGTFSLPFTVEASNMRGEVTKSVNVEIKPSTPSLTVGEVDVTPDSMSPGEQAQIQLDVVNQGKRAVDNVDISMDIADTPLLPVGETNMKQVDQVRAGTTETVAFQVTSRPDASTALYEIPFTVSYEDTSGESVEDTVKTGIRIEAEPSFHTGIRDAEITLADPRGEVSLSVINRGLAEMKLAEARIETHESFTLEDTDSYYLGDIESDDFDVLTFTITAENDTVTIPVELTYRTAFNEERTVTRSATYTIPKGQESSNTVLYVGLAVLIAGGIWWYRRSR